MWADNLGQKIIMEKLKISYTFYRKIIGKLTRCIKYHNELHPNKLKGYQKLVQIDETILNFKCKSHRGGSTRNIIDVIWGLNAVIISQNAMSKSSRIN
ncbi:hypothetical protein H311_01398 [Anncaliia algerae PRA109]|nr:hypothetical protein H311_01398 [Anncaliia algerae PRA109]